MYERFFLHKAISPVVYAAAEPTQAMVDQYTLQAAANKIQKSKEKAKKEYDETQRKNKEWQKDPHYKLDGVQAREDGPPWKNLLYG